MKKKILKKISSLYYLIIWGFLFVPSWVSAWNWGDPVVPCGTKRTPNIECSFSHIIVLIDNLLDIFIKLAIPISSLIFAWIGLIFIFEPDKVSARSKAKNKLLTLGKGLFLVLGAWLIVKLIVVGLNVKPDFNLFLNITK